MGVAVAEGTAVRFEHEVNIDAVRFGKDLAPSPAVSSGPMLYRVRSAVDTSTLFPGTFQPVVVDGAGRITRHRYDFTSFRVDIDWTWDATEILITDVDRTITDLSFGAGEIEIRRGSDGYWWDDVLGDFASPKVVNPTVAAGGTSDPYHYFDWTLPVGSAAGEFYNVLLRANSDATLERRVDIAKSIEVVSGGGGSQVFFID